MLAKEDTIAEIFILIITTEKSKIFLLQFMFSTR